MMGNELLQERPAELSADDNFLRNLDGIRGAIGNTPLRSLRYDKANLFVKMEYNNFSGSIKDRAVYNILYHATRTGEITRNTTLIESSSGNFAISLASMCRLLELRCVVVIDPNINSDYEQILHILADEVVKVSERDETGGYLLNRLKMVQHICAVRQNIYWTNQYENPNNYLAYYNGLGVEISEAFDDLHYAFIGVSTGGTLAGLSLRLKEAFPPITIIAVDVEGSVIFGSKPRKRYLSGLGASKVPPLIHKAEIDDVICLAEKEVIRGCRDLLKEQSILAGASTGAMYAAVKHYFDQKGSSKPANVIMLCPDKGSAYMNTVYNDTWVETTFH